VARPPRKPPESAFSAELPRRFLSELPQLTPLPSHVIAAATAHTTTVHRPVVVDITQRLAGEHVEVRDLADYEVAQ